MNTPPRGFYWHRSQLVIRSANPPLTLGELHRMRGERLTARLVVLCFAIGFLATMAVTWWTGGRL